MHERRRNKFRKRVHYQIQNEKAINSANIEELTDGNVVAC
jgi:hypothetical protein